MRRLARIVSRVPFVIIFAFVFLYELILANLRVAWEVITPGYSMQAGIVRVPTDCQTEWEMMFLANTITMTPGTLSLEVDTDTRDLYVHTLYVADRDEFIADVHSIERVLLRAMR